MLLSNLLLLFLLPPDVVVFLFGLVQRRHITVKDSEKLVALSCRGVLTKQTANAIELKQVKPGFTNYQPRGLANQIKFE